LLKEEEIGQTFYPPVKQIFRAFNYCKPEDIRVCIIGQDPYFKPGQAEGLSFSVNGGQKKIPSSLRNIYKELASDVEGFESPDNGHLGKWAEQGVFLLNASLTVRDGKASSHMKIGWQDFTDSVLKYLDKNCNSIIFMLWGNFAKNKGRLIDTKKHRVLTAAHPSGLSASRGFYGCKHFSKCNAYLKEKGLKEIDW